MVDGEKAEDLDCKYCLNIRGRKQMDTPVEKWTRDLHKEVTEEISD